MIRFATTETDLETPAVQAFIRRFTVLATAAAVLIAAAPIAVATDADSAMTALADAYLAALPVLSPVNATALGDHSADDKLDDLSRHGRQQRRAIIADFLSQLDAIDRSALNRANQIDAAILRNQLHADLFAIDTLQEWAWNPLYYVNVAGSSIYTLMARDFAPLESRLASAASRMQLLPELLAQARRELVAVRVPKIHAETAAAQNNGVVTIIENMIEPELSTLDAASRSEIQSAIDVAKNAIADHQMWLEDELLPRAAGDFRIGAHLFDRKLAYTLDSPMSRRDIRRRAETEYAAVRGAMYAIAKDVYLSRHPYSSMPDDPDESFKQVIIRAALERAYQQLPDADALVETAQAFLQQATDFVIEKNIVTVPDDPIEIIVMPEFQRGIALAYLDPAGPLDRDVASFYAVAPLPDDWTQEQVTSFLREYNLLSMQSLTIHEGTPGHYLQLALSNRYDSALRSVLWSGPFVEGWAVYAERVMTDEGYLNHDPLMKLINLKWYLRAITNAIIDQAIHVDGMSRDAAMKLMVEGGFQEEREAAGKWVRAQLTSTQLSTYFVGFQEHLDMRRDVEDAWGDEFTLRRYHDQALSYGSPPVKYVRAMMLDEPIP